jgi:hypothetical protein
MSTLIQLITPGDKALSFPDVKIVDFPAFDQRALLVDLGGQGYMIGQAAYTFEQWKEYIDWMVDRKYSHIFFEIIGSGKLMGNLDMEKNEWIGYPVDLKSYPQLVCRNRPLRHWDTNKNELVQGSYTAPNVQKEFLRELIDYAKARGLNVQLLIGYDYFTKQLQPVLGIPDRAPDNPQSTAFYDRVLEELITRYSNVDGVALITIETMDPAPGIHQVIIDRIKKAKQIIHKVNPKMEISLLPDYIEFSKTEMDDLRLMNDELKDVRNFYTPHHQPQQRAWNRLRPGGWKYALYTQYAWDYTVYIFPETIRNEMLKVYADGFRSVVSQAWYDDVFRLNFDALAEFTWNPTAGTADEFLDKDIAQRFSEPAREFVKQTLMHTRFDRRMDVLSRQIVQGKIKQTFTYWDMYTYHKYRVNQPFVGELRDDALQSLMAVQAALEAEKDPQARGLLDTVLISAQRRYYFAESVLRLLDALEAVDRRKWSEAEASIQTAESMAGKMMSAARRLGIQYPVALYDDDYAGKVAEYKAMILERKGSLKSAKTKSSADTED